MVTFIDKANVFGCTGCDGEGDTSMSRCEILLQELRETDRIFEICVDLCFVRRLGVLTIVLHSSCSGASCLGRRVTRRASVFDEECMACVSSTVIIRTCTLESSQKYFALPECGI